jgi:putative autoinducer-2 (AI-2) aldolase
MVHPEFQTVREGLDEFVKVLRKKRLFNSKMKRFAVNKTMEWGMKNRLAQLIQADGKALFLPIDHGYFQGPTHMLEKPGETIKPLWQYADALMMTRGVLRNCIDPTKTKPIILRVSGAATVVGEDLANENIVTSTTEIIRLNASAVSMSVFIGSKYEHQSLSNLAKLVDTCEDYGIPVMAVTAVGKELEKREARYLALCCRVAAEIGARVVKTYYCSEKFEKVVEGCPVPVVIAGGPKVATQRQVFDFVYDGIQKGAIGVNLGRNIWQTESPVAAIRAIRAVIHDGYTPQEAENLFEQVKAGKA